MYGENIVSMGCTHGTNQYKVQLWTLLVLDSLHQGFTGAFLFSNRVDSEIVQCFLVVVKDEMGIITPGVFMSDLANEFYNGWCSVMGRPMHRVFCTWHVDNLTKLGGTI